MALPLDTPAPLRVLPRVPAPDFERAEVLAYDGTNAEQVVNWLDDPRLAYLCDQTLMLLHMGTGSYLPVHEPTTVIFERWSDRRGYVLRTSDQRFTEIIYRLDQELPAAHRCEVFDPAPTMGTVLLAEPLVDSSPEVQILDELINEPFEAENPAEIEPAEITADSLAEDFCEQMVQIEQQILQEITDFAEIEQVQPDLHSDLLAPTDDPSVSQAAFSSVHHLRDFRASLPRS